MTLTEAQDEFAIRYYLWAREDFRLEIERNFPLLKQLDIQSSKKCLRLMDDLSLNDKLAFSVALLKGSHKRAVAILGETPNSDENEMVNKYINLPLFEDAIYEDEPSCYLSPKLNRRFFIKRLKARLATIFGDRFEQRGKNEWRYTSETASLRTHTYIDVGGRFHNLCYSHAIVFEGYYTLVEHTSVLSWLGLISQTYWRQLDDTKVENAVNSLVQACSRFLNAAPALAKGIEP